MLAEKAVFRPAPARDWLRALERTARLDSAPGRTLPAALGELALDRGGVGRRAVGVHYRRDGLKLKAGARREVILCGGPINSPQLLKLSGVGPAAELGAFGIDAYDVTNRDYLAFVRDGGPVPPNWFERDGAWFGRWGVNYVYGTSGALAALGPTQRGRRDVDESVVRGAVWLKSVQNGDGGWGETTASYIDPALRGAGPSTASQTAWALIGLLAALERLPALAAAFMPSIERGVRYLLATQTNDGTWNEPEFTGTGFPQHFYLNYHQYRLHFPLSALGRYAALCEAGLSTG